MFIPRVGEHQFPERLSSKVPWEMEGKRLADMTLAAIMKQATSLEVAGSRSGGGCGTPQLFQPSSHTKGTQKGKKQPQSHL